MIVTCDASDMAWTVWTVWTVEFWSGWLFYPSRSCSPWPRFMAFLACQRSRPIKRYQAIRKSRPKTPSPSASCWQIVNLYIHIVLWIGDPWVSIALHFRLQCHLELPCITTSLANPGAFSRSGLSAKLQCDTSNSFSRLGSKLRFRTGHLGPFYERTLCGSPFCL